MSRHGIIGLSLVVLAAAVPQAQTASPSDNKAGLAGSYSGCVQRSSADKDVWLISGANICAKLSGKFSKKGLASHQAVVKGPLSERTSTTPATIRVESITSTEKSCSETCTLQPPGTRGVGKRAKGEKPGREGGTPGIVPSHPPN